MNAADKIAQLRNVHAQLLRERQELGSRVLAIRMEMENIRAELLSLAERAEEAEKKSEAEHVASLERADRSLL